MSVYVTTDMIKTFTLLVKNSPVRERKNSIVLRCLLSGLKTEYGIDLNKKEK